MSCFIVIEKAKKCPFAINNQCHPQEIVLHLQRGMEAVQVIRMEVIGLEVQVFLIQIQILIRRIRRVRQQIPMGPTVVRTVHTLQTIKVHTSPIAIETPVITTVTVIVVMQVLQFLLKHWLILTWLRQITQKCTKTARITLKIVAGILHGGICIGMVAFTVTGHCQDHKAL